MIKYLTLSLFMFQLFYCISCKKSTNPLTNGPDTTSHEFTWVIDTFGIYPSHLKDVFVISETDIWAVGEIHTEDTDCWNEDSTEWIPPYNAVYWDGEKWNMQRIPAVTSMGSISKGPMRAVFAYSSNDVWIFSQAGSYAHWDGQNWESEYISERVGSINKIWGNNPNNIYFVGTNGNITHYNGQKWERIESGTNVDLTDIWGNYDGSVIWACGFEDDKGSVLLRNTGSGFEKVLEITSPNIPHPPNQITHIFKSLWTDKTDSVYLGAIGRVYIAPKNTNGYARESFWWDYDNETGYPPSTEAIRGTTGNDFFVAGYNLFIEHFNGKSWYRYKEIEGNGIWYSVAVNKYIIVAVGRIYDYPQGVVIIRGYRNN